MFKFRNIRWQSILQSTLILGSALSLSEPALAQTRTMTENSPGFLRSWLGGGNWGVMLVHSDDGRFVCVAITGRKGVDAIEYLFGVEEDTQNLFVFVDDQNPEALAGQNVKVAIDNTLIGTYPVDKRKSGLNLSSIRALVPAADAANLLSLLKIGGSVQITTDAATYSASLTGMAATLEDFQTCLIEAHSLSGRP